MSDPRRRLDPARCNGCGYPVGACDCSSIRQRERDGYAPGAPVEQDVDVEVEQEDDLPGYLRGKYATLGVESIVLDADGEEIGHVGLLDLDETSRGAAEEAARRLPGPVAILRSSRRSYHLWALSVDSLDAWQSEALDVGVDLDHIAISAARDVSVLRLDAKVGVGSGEEVAPEPVLLSVREESPPSTAATPCSAPHAEILRERFGADLDVEEAVGDSTERRTFLAEIGGGS
jgi:fermentation-respiration switch protein FrsA (DUF1100 family)